jgi:hypothetical protein
VGWMERNAPPARVSAVDIWAELRAEQSAALEEREREARERRQWIALRRAPLLSILPQVIAVAQVRLARTELAEVV